MELNMGIIKFEVNLDELTQAVEQFKQNRMKVFETLSHEVKGVVAKTLDQLLHAEMAVFLGKPEQSGNKRNGYEERQYALKGIGSIRIRVPIDRQRKFKSEIILPREQIDPRLKEDLAVLHLAGLSTRTLSLVSHRLLGVRVSKDTVSQSLGVIEEKALKWLQRPLSQEYWALFVDGTNFRIQRRGSTEKEPSLVVLGLDERNCLSILAIEPGHKDNVVSWESVFRSLKQRGLNTQSVRVGVMDGLPGLEKLFKQEFPHALTGRCWVHALRNAIAKTPARLTDPFKMMAHKVMYAGSEDEARRAFLNLKQALGSDCERAVACLEKDLDSLLVHYRFEKTLWRSLRTTNPIERVNKELKRRVKSMETLGERTLQILLAFTALRLEYHWQVQPVNSKSLENLLEVKNANSLEAAVESLLH